MQYGHKTKCLVVVYCILMFFIIITELLKFGIEVRYRSLLNDLETYSIS